jgi:pyruvate/2-oxoglutarate dehydrogenase complex dihydrolipoamide dehydrogenase (E3) component
LLVDKFPLLANNHAKAIDDAEGIVKVMADKETNKILDVHIMVSNAGEIIHQAMLALQYGASSDDVFYSMSHNTDADTHTHINTHPYEYMQSNEGVAHTSHHE